MLLRHITTHLEDQIWFDIGLDFFIVVIGVFIGNHLGNLNDARFKSNRGRLAQSRSSAFNAEVAHNDATLQ